MTAQSDRAETLFRDGAACSQAVLAAFCERYGLDAATAMRLACGFGGGAKCGELCGAVSGAVMVVGLKYGQADPADKEAKKTCSNKTAECINAFTARHKKLTCRDLLGCDITTPEGRKQALDAKLFTTACVSFVLDAVRILEEQGY